MRLGEYTEEIDGIVEEIRSEIAEGKIEDRDDLERWLDELVGPRNDTEALAMLVESKHREDYFDEFGKNNWPGWITIAAFAHRCDVVDALRAADIDPDDPVPHGIDCPTCKFRVPCEEDATVCPRCGWVHREEREGFVVGGASVCEACLGDGEDPNNQTALMTGEVFDCSRCDTSFEVP